MRIELLPATIEQTPVLRRLMQLYLYDIASLDDWDLREDGLYGNPERIETFWVDGDYERILIRVDGVLAGFVLTSRKIREDDETIHVISEFFVLRRYRRAGVGKVVATRLFERVAGVWEVSVMRINTPAQEFWAAVIRDLTGRERSAFTMSEEGDEDVVFRFVTSVVGVPER